MDYEPLVGVTRGGLDESVHYGGIVVADAEGKILAGAGSPQATSFLRSSAKPLQGLPLIASGAADHFALTPAEIAIILGSHNGEPRHVETVRSILSKIGMTENDLMCGAHAPYHRPTAKALTRAGKSPSVLHNNCSGKHAGMLALALFRKQPPEGYFEASHPVQVEILEAVSAITRVPRARISIAVDGCTVPTFAIPLAASAAAYARLMEPEPLGPALARAARRAVEAMIAHPEMVAGEGRLDTDLMSRGAGALIAKAGAEGNYAIGFRRKGMGYGLTLKVADGNNDRARTAIVLRAVRDLGLLSDEKADSLASAHLPPIKDRRDRIVGHVETRFHLDMKA
jgi:L-asparaginase II